jgi:hypothetical protein
VHHAITPEKNIMPARKTKSLKSKIHIQNLSGVVEEKQVLTTQLIRRGDELNKLYEKLKIQQSKLLHGETEYKAVCKCKGV